MRTKHVVVIGGGISGLSAAFWLKENGVSIWDEWATEDGELGPIYGAQWTAWPTRDGGTVNQIDYVIDCLRNNPDSRRILFHAWNVEYLPDERITRTAIEVDAVRHRPDTQRLPIRRRRGRVWIRGGRLR